MARGRTLFVRATLGIKTPSGATNPKDIRSLGRALEGPCALSITL